VLNVKVTQDFVEVIAENIERNLVQVTQHMSLFLGFKFGSLYCSSWGKSHVGAILILVEHDWMKWSRDKYNVQKYKELGFQVRV